MNAASMNPIGKHVKVWTYILPDGEWRFYDGLILYRVLRFTTEQEDLLDVILIDGHGGIRIERSVAHYTDRISSHYWKWLDEEFEEEEA